MPGTDRWVRDQSYIIEEGSGLGTLSDPRGLYWVSAGGRGLFGADFGKNWVQKLSDVTSSTGLYKIDADTLSALNGPLDVAADLQGYVYLTDTGNRRVLRFDQYGQFVQRVDVEPDSYGQPLVDPIGLAADDTLVYVGDRATNKVVRYQRRK
jgi:sugar lactone lactonase YvrE